MGRVTVREVQHNLAEILRRVEAGEEIEVHRRHKLVARLIPPTSAPDREVDWAGLKEWRRITWGKKPTSGTPIERVVAEARGDR
jgi:antitoxin (DNA-binding transcriptional repressor) of toxin-antitoxin stability system